MVADVPDQAPVINDPFLRGCWPGSSRKLYLREFSEVSKQVYLPVVKLARLCVNEAQGAHNVAVR